MYARRYFPGSYFAPRYWLEAPAASSPPSIARVLFAAETDEAFLPLLTIAHPDLAQPIRVVHNNQDVVSRGEIYTAYPFEIDLPDEDPDQPPRVTLRIDNVDRLIVATIRTIASPPTVTLEVVMASMPDTVEAGPFQFTLRDVSYDALVVEGELAFENILNEPYPAGDYTPASHPGLF